MIIDSHVHIGNSVWGNFSPEELMNIVGDSVDYALCSHLAGIDDTDFNGIILDYKTKDNYITFTLKGREKIEANGVKVVSMLNYDLD